MIDSVCKMGTKLRLKYLQAEPDVRPWHKTAYEQHIRHCAACLDYVVELTTQAEKAKMPNIQIEKEIN